MMSNKCPCGQPAAQCQYSQEKRALACPSFGEINEGLRREQELEKQLAEAQEDIKRKKLIIDAYTEDIDALEKKLQAYEAFVAAFNEWSICLGRDMKKVNQARQALEEGK